MPLEVPRIISLQQLDILIVAVPRHELRIMPSADGRGVPHPRADLVEAPGPESVFETAVAVLTQVRRHKSEAKASLRTPVEKIRVVGRHDVLESLEAALDDVLSAGGIRHAELCAGDAEGVSVHLEGLRV